MRELGVEAGGTGGALSAFLGHPPLGGDQNPGGECRREETRGGRGTPERIGWGEAVTSPGKDGRGLSERVGGGGGWVRCGEQGPGRMEPGGESEVAGGWWGRDSDPLGQGHSPLTPQEGSHSSEQDGATPDGAGGDSAPS